IAQASCAIACIRQSRRLTCVSSCAITIQRHSIDQWSASFGNNTSDRINPQVIGMEIRSVLKILTRRRRRNLVASVRASMIHELSVTRCARRVNNQTLVVPTVKRAITANKPASQASDSATFQSNLFQKGATGFGVTSNRGETGFEAGNSAPMSNGRRSASRRASGSGARSSASAATLALEPTRSEEHTSELQSLTNLV